MNVDLSLLLSRGAHCRHTGAVRCFESIVEVSVTRVAAFVSNDLYVDILRACGGQNDQTGEDYLKETKIKCCDRKERE